MSNKIVAKAAEIVRQNTVYGGEAGFGICTLSLIDEDGFPTAAIMTASKSDGIKWLVFGTLLNGNRAKRVMKNNRASVCFGTEEYCVNLVGEIEIITEDAMRREIWYDGLSGHFTGPDDPNYCVLKFTTKRYKFFIDFEDVSGVL